MSKLYSKEIANKIEKTLVKDGCENYIFDKEQGFFTIFLGMNAAIKELRIVIDIFENDYLVLVVSPVGVENNDNQIMIQLAEYLCRLNYEIKNGSFEISFEAQNAGEIRYKIYVDCEDRLPSEAIIRNSIYIAAATFEKYSNGIINAIFSGRDADHEDNILKDITDYINDESIDASQIIVESEE